MNISPLLILDNTSAESLDVAYGYASVFFLVLT